MRRGDKPFPLYFELSEPDRGCSTLMAMKYIDYVLAGARRFLATRIRK